MPRSGPRKTTEQFVAQARARHGDRYDYSQSVYRNAREHLTVVCPEHGAWEVSPDNHVRGKGCPACRNRKSERISVSAQEERFRATHGDRYTYPEQTYRVLSDKIRAVCPEHGEFTVVAMAHAQGRGCPTCGFRRRDEAKRKTYAEFLAQARARHGDRYDYALSTDYAGSTAPVTVTCRVHGPWRCPTADKHLQGKGCPTCGRQNSAPEQELADMLARWGVQVERGARVPGALKMSVDLFLPEHKVAVEYQGLFWHSTGAPNALDAKTRHERKRLACEAAGWRYVAIYEDEWLGTPGKVEGFLRALTGRAVRRHARALEVMSVDAAVARAFYEKHHFLGAGTASGEHMALVDAGGIPRAVMSFARATERRGNTDAGEWSLTRFASDGVVVGGASRLMAAAIPLLRTRNVRRLVSYIDLDKYRGGVYETLGFGNPEYIAPDYWTIHGKQRRHKTATKRAALAAAYPEKFDPTLTEEENCRKLGIFRIYHSGRVKVSMDVGGT